MKKLSRTLLCLTLAAAMIFSLVSCGGEATPGASSTPNDPGSSSPTAPTEARDTIKIAISRDFTSLDGFVGNAQSYGIAWSIFDTLVDMDGDLNVYPRLATSWEQVDDLTWRIDLRDDVTFTNGEKFNAESAAYSVNYMASLGTGYTSWKQWGLAWPPAAEVESEYSILIKTPAPCPVMPQMLARGSMLPLEASQSEEFWNAPVGTGPYTVVDWNVGVSVDLESNPNYWGGEPSIKHLHYDIVKNADARTAALKTGEYDYIVDVPFDMALDMLNGNASINMDLIHINSISFNYLYFNGLSENKFIQNAEFRKAMQYAIDSKGIVDYIFGGLCKEAKNITAMGINGTYDAGGFPARDVAKAQELAAQCGYNGEEIVMMVADSNFNYDAEVVELVVSQLQEAGFNIKYQEVDSATWSSQYKGTGGYDISTNNYGGSYTNDSEMYYTQGIKNCGWSYPEAEAIMEKLYTGIHSSEERNELLTDLVEVCWNECPFLWASEGVVLHAAKSDLHGYEVFRTNGQLNFINAYIE